MFRPRNRLLSLLFRSSSISVKRLWFPTTVFYLYQKYNNFQKVCCIDSPVSLQETISAIQQNTVRIECNGDFVSYAFCFAQNYLVSVMYDSHENHSKNKKRYQFYLGDRKLSGKFQIIGQYQNLTFLEFQTEEKIQPLASNKKNQRLTISPVKIFMKRAYPSIKNGYFVSEDSGYGIIDGKGEIGSLILKEEKTIGIATQVGRDNENGFLRVIEWRHLPNILKYIKGKRHSLGISAQAHQQKQGIQIVRIAPNSPFIKEMMMGDFVKKINGQTIRTVEAFQRVYILSEGELTLQIIREETPLEIKIKI